MAKKKRDRRSFTDEFKQQLIAEIDGGKKLIDVAKENGLQPSQLSLWRKKFGSGRAGKKSSRAARQDAPKAAAKRTAAPAAAAPRAESIPQTPNADLERMIGKLVIENDRLKREIAALRSR